ncbi:TRAP transporter TatT component family protein [Cyclobacteriaceae bacterium]|nr:TRAP transporter TatT component family protein [Cyclobacteriaceae bacterium]
MKIYKTTSIIALTFLLFICSCVSFSPEWNKSEVTEATDTVNILLQKAKNMELNASTSQELKELIDCYLEIEKIDPNNYLALWKIGNYQILMGAAYATDKKTKKHHYREAIKYCEKAMYTNEAFRKEISDKKKIVEACEVLTINEIDAMGYWYTARFYYFKECINPLGKALNTSIVIENNKVIDCIDKINPNWAGGGNYFSRALYYIATPKRFGGSLERADTEFSTAIKVGPNFIVNRWGRAKYLYSLTGNEAGFKSDMEWVIAQDPHKGGNPYAWNIYFQNDAKKELIKLENN